MAKDRYSGVLFVLSLTTVMAQETPNLFMIANDNKVYCVAEESGAEASIMWTNVSSSDSNSLGFDFQSKFPNNCARTQITNFCQWPWRDLGGWLNRSSLEWSLPPIHYYKWEKLPILITSKRQTQGTVSVPESPWTMGVSVRVTSNAEMFLCDKKGQNCYWVVVNDKQKVGEDPELLNFVSSVRRCQGIKPSSRNNEKGCGRSTQQEPKGRIGVEGDWLHLRLDWVPKIGQLKVFFRDNDTTYKQLLIYTDDMVPLEVSFITVRSIGFKGEWRLHNYDALGLSASAPGGKLIKTDKYYHEEVKHCFSFFYVIFPGHKLNVTMVKKGNNIEKVEHLGLLTAQPADEELEWREARFTINNSPFQDDPKLLYDFQVEGILGQTSTASEDVAVVDSMRECDPTSTGDVRISYLKEPDKIKNESPFECYLSTKPGSKVRFGAAIIEEANSTSAAAALRLCKLVDKFGLQCDNTVLCFEDTCTCSAGFLGSQCKEECGSDEETRNMYGPGCTDTCGNCTLPDDEKAQICHHVSGNCLTNECQGDYDPPLCKELKKTSKGLTRLSASAGTVAAVFIASVVLLALIMVLIKKRKQLKQKLRKEMKLILEGGKANVNPNPPLLEQADQLPYCKSWEFPREKL